MSGAPVLRRELIALLRTRQAFWGLVAAVALSAVVPLILWPRGTDDLRAAGSVARLAAAFLLTQATVVLTVVPAFTAASIARERQQDTWDSLLATPITVSAVLTAKSIACLAYALLLLAATAPVFVILELLGGVGGSEILRCYVVLGATAVLSAFLTPLFAFRFHRPWVAMIAGIAGAWVLSVVQVVNAMLYLWSLPRALEASLKATDDSPPEQRRSLRDLYRRWVLPALWVMAAMGCVPLAAVFLLGRGQAMCFPHLLIYGFILGRPYCDLWSFYVGYALVLSGVASVCLRIVTCADSTQRVDPRTLPGWGSLLASRMPLRTRLPPSRAAMRVIELGERGWWPWRNVMFLKEVRCARLPVRRTLGALLAGALVGIFGFVCACILGSPHIRTVCCASLGLLLGAFLSILLPVSIAGEREGQRWDLLRGTSLSSRDILAGKALLSLYWIAPFALGAAGAMVSLFVLMFACSLEGALSVAVAAREVVEGLCIAGGIAAFATAASTLAGVVAARSTTALTLAFAMLLVPIAIGLLLPGPAGWILAAPKTLLALCLASAPILWLAAEALHARLHGREP